MHSSTSNSEINIPFAKWGLILPATLLAFLLTIAFFEIFARSQGYAPTLNDEKYLWAKTRARVKPNDVVIIGSSRALFDIDLDELELALGVKDIKQLAMTGSSPAPILENLANDANFKGTIICGIVPGLFFTPDNIPPMNKPKEWVKAYLEFSPSEKTNLMLNHLLESNLAYLKQDDLPLKELLKKIPLQNRDNVMLPPKLPPYFFEIDKRREAKMIQKVMDDQIFREKIQNVWLPLFTPPPFPPFIKPEQIPDIIEKMIAAKIKTTKESVDKLKSRGVKIIFVRFPSSDKLKDLESKLTPRQQFWDRLLLETGVKGIHWEDYDNLKHFTCPEWSHLSAADTVKFSKEIGFILKEMLANQK